LTRRRDHGGRITRSQNSHFKLKDVEPTFYDHASVKRTGVEERVSQRGLVLDPRDPDGGSLVGRFDEAWAADVFKDALYGTFEAVLEISFEEVDPGDHWNAHRTRDVLQHNFVHADGRRSDAASDVGDVAKFKGALDGPVFSIGAVKERKYDIGGDVVPAAYELAIGDDLFKEVAARATAHDARARDSEEFDGEAVRVDGVEEFSGAPD
jgi:hypothetical protein